MPSGDAPVGEDSRIVRLLSAVPRQPTSERTRRILLGLAAILFVVVTAASFASLASEVRVNWVILPFILLVTSPLTLLANTAEFQLMGRLTGHRITWLPAARLTVAAAVANLLPLPGGVLIRTQALYLRGTSYPRALAANATAGAAWIGCGGITFAAVDARDGMGARVAIVGVIALLAIAAAAVLVRRFRAASFVRIFGRLLVIEGATVVVSAVRVYLAFRLLGLTASAAQSVALTAAQIVSAAIGIFPGGLGLREALAGVIGTVVDVPVAQSIAATASDRVTGQVFLALVAVALVAFPTLRGPDLTQHDSREEPSR